eukprot:scaffold9713_cov103-Isochrysis_galbana.AAC.5
MDDSRRPPHGKHKLPQFRLQRAEAVRRCEEHELTKIGHAPILQREEVGVEAACPSLNQLEICKYESRDIGRTARESISVIEASVVAPERCRIARTAIGFNHGAHDGRPSGAR